MQRKERQFRGEYVTLRIRAAFEHPKTSGWKKKGQCHNPSQQARVMALWQRCEQQEQRQYSEREEPDTAGVKIHARSAHADRAFRAAEISHSPQIATAIPSEENAASMQIATLRDINRVRYVSAPDGSDAAPTRGSDGRARGRDFQRNPRYPRWRVQVFR